MMISAADWLPLCVTGLTLLLCLFLVKEHRSLKRQLQQLAEAQAEPNKDLDFSGRLSLAERDISFPTDVALLLEERQQDKGTDRYRQVAELMQQGQGAEEISEVLQLSETEVDQLLALARLKCDKSTLGH